MNIKKLAPVLLSVVLLGTVGIGATLAYFTDNDSAGNVITMGHVDIELTEPAWDSQAGDEGISNIVPGQSIAKDPTITLQEGSLDAYVRVKLEIEGLESEKADEILENIQINEGWKAVDGYYYYENKLTEETKEAVLFNEVVIPYSWDNDMAGVLFNINVSAEAVQADHLQDDFINEDGSWNITTEEILKYESQD